MTPTPPVSREGPRLIPAPAPTREDDLTWVELVFDKGRTERWIRFGAVVDQRIVTRQNRFVAFHPGSIFAFVRWAAGDRGTVVSRLDILIAPHLSEPRLSVPGVTPGGVSLLRLTGWPRVKAALEAIDAIEALGIDPADAAPAYWRHVHNRLTANLEPHAYTPERHAAWLHRRRIEP